MKNAITLRMLVVEPDKLGDVNEIHAAAYAMLSTNPGFHSETLWQSDVNENTFLAVARFKDMESAEAAVVPIIESPLFPRIVQSLVLPADVHWTQMAWHRGIHFCDVLPENRMAVVLRYSNLGETQDLLQEVIAVDQDLLTVDGCLGVYVGQNYVLEEEVVSMTIWRDDISLLKGIPKAPDARTLTFHLYQGCDG